MRAYPIEDICAAVEGTLLQSTEEKITGAATDSRQVGRGTLFVALQGERVDGHDFVPAALGGGASACLVEKKPEELTPGKGYILVDSTLLALKKLAVWYRDQFTIPFVQVTGSAGKTTTKEMIASVLSRHFPTLRTQGNLNSNIGTPLTLLNLSEEHRCAVIETGMTHFGEIRDMGEMVRPDFAVITNVGDAHAEYLGNSRLGVLRAKLEILENLKSDGVVVLNGDDELLREVTSPHEIILCGRGENCAVRVTDVEELGVAGTRCTVTTPREVYRLHIQSPGGYMIYPVSMAIAIAERLGLTGEEILRGIDDYRPVGARMHIIRLPQGRIIVDDCYNANPQSMVQALRLLGKTEGRRVAVLGDMGELGELTASGHRSVGEETRKNGIDVVIAIGEKARDIAAAAVEQTYWFPDIEAAVETVRRAFTPGTALLVKASRAMAFERIVKELEKSK